MTIYYLFKNCKVPIERHNCDTLGSLVLYAKDIIQYPLPPQKASCESRPQSHCYHGQGRFTDNIDQIFNLVICFPNEYLSSLSSINKNA